MSCDSPLPGHGLGAHLARLQARLQHPPPRAASACPVLDPAKDRFDYGVILYQTKHTVADAEKVGEHTQRGWHRAAEYHSRTGEVPSVLVEGRPTRYLELSPRTSLKHYRAASRQVPGDRYFDLPLPFKGVRLKARLLTQLKRHNKRQRRKSRKETT